MKVLAVTGIRSEYDILYPVLNHIRNDKSFELKLVVCGAHLSDWHGHTLNKIEEDGFEVTEKIDYLLMTNRKTQRSKGIGILISSLTQTVERESPDFLLFVGDREESIAASVVANYMDVLSVHIGGGDAVFGNADDPIRFACSELSHIHFTTTKQYADNLLSIGEESKRVIFSGNPSLTNIKKTPRMDKRSISKELGIKLEDFLVLIKHPLSSVKHKSYEQMKITLEVLSNFIKDTNLKVIGIRPNTDPGSYDILKAIEESNNEQIIFFKNLPRHLFINLMRHTKALVGNSSMGLLEAPFYKLPVVNIGERQKGRLNAGNVEFTDYNKKVMLKALHKAVFDTDYREYVKKIDNPYGKGDSEKIIVSFLKKLDLSDKSWLIKKKMF